TSTACVYAKALRKLFKPTRWWLLLSRVNQALVEPPCKLMQQSNRAARISLRTDARESNEAEKCRLFGIVTTCSISEFDVSTSPFGHSTSTETLKSGRQAFNAEKRGVERTVSPSERRRINRTREPLGRPGRRSVRAMVDTVTQIQSGSRFLHSRTEATPLLESVTAFSPQTLRSPCFLLIEHGRLLLTRDIERAARLYSCKPLARLCPALHVFSWRQRQFPRIHD